LILKSELSLLSSLCDSSLPRETGNEWDKELAEDVKGECEEKYGKVERIKVEKETQVSFIRIYYRITSS
jgi:RNA-binding protein 23/39